MQGFSFATIKTVISDLGSCGKQLGTVAKSLAVTRALIITDKGIVASGLIQPALDSLKAAHIDAIVYTDVVADPPEHIVEQALDFARTQQIDGVIGLGGGSSMDVAKVIALLTYSSQKLAHVYGVANATGSRLPLIQIPTTAGTGSEVTPISIITTGATTKQGIVSPLLLADVAILDAELTVGLPPEVTAATGVDAMVHAIEAYTSKHRKNPYSDLLACEALRLLSRHIVTAVEEGHNLIARSAMLYGAMLAGQAFANAPVAAVHALAYPLGGHYHISHGLSNSLVLPHVLHFNLPAATAEYAQLANVINPYARAKQITLAEYFIDAMQTLIHAVKLPNSLRKLHVPETDLPMLAKDAMQQQRLLVNNPRELTEADALAIYQAAF
ncbi:iron-containing alcohol dehydrogenase [Agitococcus lubricus]|uniref:Alcohol dehydrogenase class IV n=1 Tax=Agitococcus lubricus TaxID=1077255 RepID=A0A2T5J3N5_9GAMM|nr:iron-containing alcohol dehydrogenase [Agitococcus lubricus]PTQ91227.1 alcohol dehydrogenase class IV [Agitococcus lubricus]